MMIPPYIHDICLKSRAVFFLYCFILTARPRILLCMHSTYSSFDLIDQNKTKIPTDPVDCRSSFWLNIPMYCQCTFTLYVRLNILNMHDIVIRKNCWTETQFSSGVCNSVQTICEQFASYTLCNTMLPIENCPFVYFYFLYFNIYRTCTIFTNLYRDIPSELIIVISSVKEPHSKNAVSFDKTIAWKINRSHSVGFPSHRTLSNGVRIGKSVINRVYHMPSVLVSLFDSHCFSCCYSYKILHTDFR